MLLPEGLNDCSPLTLSVILLVDNKYENNKYLKTINATNESERHCRFDTKVMENVTSYMDQSDLISHKSIYNYGGDTNKLRVFMKLDNLPENARFYKKTFRSADFTKAGVIYDFIRSIKCDL